MKPLKIYQLPCHERSTRRENHVRLSRCRDGECRKRRCRTQSCLFASGALLLNNAAVDFRKMLNSLQSQDDNTVEFFSGECREDEQKKAPRIAGLGKKSGKEMLVTGCRSTPGRPSSMAIPRRRPRYV